MNASLDPVATGAVIPPEAGVEPDPFALLARLEAIPFVLDESPLVLERGLAEEQGFDELWRQMDSHGRDPRRFDRNLSRLLDGFSARTR